MGKRNKVDVPVLSMVTSGDAARQEQGSSELMRNVIIEAGPKVSKRSGWDATGSAVVSSGIEAFMRWQDEPNAAEKLVAQTSSALHVWSGSAWGAAISGGAAGLKDYANHLGKLIWSAAGALYAYDGTTLGSNPLKEALSADSLTSWIGRLFLGRAKQVITNLLSTSEMYGGSWASTTVTAESVTSGGKTTTRFRPTATFGVVESTAVVATGIAASAEGIPYVWRADLKGESADQQVPVTIGLAVAADTAQRITPYVIGDLVAEVVATAPYFPIRLFRCTTAGTTAGVAPTFPLDAGDTVTDGAVVWTNIGSLFFATTETYVGAETWQTEWVAGELPPRTNSVDLYATIFWGHLSRFEDGDTVEFPPYPLQVGFKDGLADTNPLKRNYGQQVTQGKFFYEFVNTESGVSRTLDLPNRSYFTDALTLDIDADNYIDFTETPGPITCVKAIDEDTLAIMKRKGILLVAPGPTASVPVVRSGLLPGVGAIHARAVAQYEGITYFVGEYGVYAFNGQGAPVEITTDKIRDSLFGRTSWIEDGASLANIPTLRVHEKRKEIWVMTQQKQIFVYSIPRKAWTVFNIVTDANGTTGAVRDFIFFNDTMHLMGATNGPVKEGALRDEVYAGGAATAYSTPAELWLRPVESLRREDVLIESLEVRHEATASQAAHTITAYVSKDDGVTFPYSHQVRLTASTGGLTVASIPLWQTGDRLTVKLVSEGDAGSAVFNLFSFSLWFQVLSGEEVMPDSATSLSASL